MRRVGKSPKRKQEVKTDKLWGLFIRERADHTCQRCGKPGNQPHHIFSRRYKAVRHDPDNGICLCFGCHKHVAHEKPEEFRDFVIDLMGKTKYLALKKKAYVVGGDYDPSENEKILLKLKGV